MHRKSFLSIIGVLFIAINAFAIEFSGNLSPTADCFVPARETFVLRNTSDTEQTFRIRASGENREWINLNGKWIFEQPLVVRLAAQQATELFAFLKPQDCYVEPGSYPITIEIISSESTTRAINLQVVPIRTISLQSIKPGAEVTQCKQAVFNFTIENTGKSDELVELAVEGIPSEWASFSTKEFLLERGVKRAFQLQLTPSCDAETMQHDFLLKALLTGTSFFAKQSLSVSIKDAQDIELTAPEITVCNDEEKILEFLAKNTGLLDDTLQLRVEGTEWIALQREELFIGAAKEESLSVRFKESNALPGNYDFNIVMQSPRFRKRYVFPLQASLSDCHGAKISKATVGENAFSPGLESCVEEPLLFNTALKNTGEKPITLELSVKGANGTVDPRSLSLKVGEEKQATARVFFDGVGEQSFSLSINSEHYNSEQEYLFKAVDCYALSVDYGSILSGVDVNAEQELAFTLLLKNNGTKELEVDTNVSGVDWVFFQPEKRIVQPGREEGVFLYLSPAFDSREGNYSASISISARDFEESKEIPIKLYGGLYALIGETKLVAESSVSGVSEAVEKSIELKVSLKNDGNSFLRITAIDAIGYNAGIDFREARLDPGQETELKLTLYLGKDFNKQQFVVPLRLSTDKGELVKSIGVDLSKPVTQPTALASLGTTKDLLIIILSVIVIVLIAIVAIRSGREETGITEIAKEAEEQPRKKLEETGRKRIKKK